MRFVGFVFIVFLLMGCTSDEGSNPGVTSTSITSDSTSSTDTIVPVIPEGEEYVPPTCTEMPNYTAKDICFYNQALNDKNRRVCESIGNKHFKSGCRAQR